VAQHQGLFVVPPPTLSLHSPPLYVLRLSQVHSAGTRPTLARGCFRLPPTGRCSLTSPRAASASTNSATSPTAFACCVGVATCTALCAPTRCSTAGWTDALCAVR
jgi:hypothetical protein